MRRYSRVGGTRPLVARCRLEAVFVIHDFRCQLREKKEVGHVDVYTFYFEFYSHYSSSLLLPSRPFSSKMPVAYQTMKRSGPMFDPIQAYLDQAKT